MIRDDAPSLVVEFGITQGRGIGSHDASGSHVRNDPIQAFLF
jgi:hypothetical protein